MAKYQNIDAIIDKMRNDVTQSLSLENVAFTSQFSSKDYVQRTLEVLNTTNNVNYQIKLFSVLSACLMFNNYTNVDVIIKSRAVYDKIHEVLKKGLPRKATDALNFLSVLLYVNAKEDGITTRKSLALYARNMTRISGCLDAMTEMFTDCMMYHDTWKALCQCLAIACSDCQRNKSYCSHLIPVCIQKCSQTNIDVFLVLQSLLLNHDRNIQLFLRYKGTAIFHRGLLHYDQSLQLLITVVQCPAAMPILVRHTRVVDDLKDFVRLYGLSSQIGQKSMIILKHIESRSRGPEFQIYQNINKDKQQKNENESTRSNSNAEIELDDTKTLMQNVLKEVFNYNKRELQHSQRPSEKGVSSLVRGASAIVLSSANREMDRNVFNKQNNGQGMDKHLRNQLHRNIAANVSFSFSQNQHSGDISHCEKTRNKFKTSNVKRAELDVDTTRTQTWVNTENDLPFEKPSVVDFSDFKPVFSSTLRHDKEYLDRTRYSSISRRKSNLTNQSQTVPRRTTRVEKRTREIIPKSKDKDLRNRSVGTRFLSAINDSCTTLVKTVASIFKKKEITNSEDSTDMRQSQFSHEENSWSHSFSFLNYMKERDVALNSKLMKNRNKERVDFSLETKLCETCDDTEVLKNKMAKDELLKQTVKKLKLGINLYGCDFKKISKTMWPQQSYMTPAVLYNLYRKLLLKRNN